LNLPILCLVYMWELPLSCTLYYFQGHVS
jgi:hypothetical protein